MAVSNAYLDFIIEQLDPLGEITSKHMFGGAGLYLNGLMFALVANDQLYLKVDESSRPRFVSEGLQPFTFATKKGTRGAMSYFEPPESALDDQDELVEWAREGYAAAVRAADAQK